MRWSPQQRRGQVPVALHPHPLGPSHTRSHGWGAKPPRPSVCHCYAVMISPLLRRMYCCSMPPLWQCVDGSRSVRPANLAARTYNGTPNLVPRAPAVLLIARRPCPTTGLHISGYHSDVCLHSSPTIRYDKDSELFSWNLRNVQLHPTAAQCAGRSRHCTPLRHCPRRRRRRRVRRPHNAIR